mmetsp:Transcript_14018/g.39652  ORF Transcript_14018/g.39652 Transcript_14018/m.39652 type:complete len:202 (-) Transcript_14018:535-1140(-)
MLCVTATASLFLCEWPTRRTHELLRWPSLPWTAPVKRTHRIPLLSCGLCARSRSLRTADLAVQQLFWPRSTRYSTGSRTAATPLHARSPLTSIGPPRSASHTGSPRMQGSAARRHLLVAAPGPPAGRPPQGAPHRPLARTTRHAPPDTPPVSTQPCPQGASAAAAQPGAQLKSCSRPSTSGWGGSLTMRRSRCPDCTAPTS